MKETALRFGIGELGKQEIPKGSNWGADVKKYLASVGINSPAPWCMSFVYWCFSQAANELGVPNPLFKTGGVLLQYQKRKNDFGLRANPQAGDIFIMQFKGGLGHTGIVEKSDEQFIYTVEGNSNEDGSREGYEVCRHKRPKTSILGYLRF